MEREEKRELYRICCSSEENNVGDDMDGGIWEKRVHRGEEIVNGYVSDVLHL